MWLINRIFPQSYFDDGECIVCSYDFVEEEKVLWLNCGHLFHEACVKEWVDQKEYCPKCELKLGKITNLSLKDYLNAGVEKAADFILVAILIASLIVWALIFNYAFNKLFGVAKFPFTGEEWKQYFRDHPDFEPLSLASFYLYTGIICASLVSAGIIYGAYHFIAKWINPPSKLIYYDPNRITIK